MTINYTINQDGEHYDEVQGLNNAIKRAEELLNGVADGKKATITVENEDGYLMATITNRRIVGSFTKQRWGGRKGDNAIYIDEADFDATDSVLLMTHARLVELDDNDESSDEIGRSYVDWSGPCSVSIVNSVCAYFGVSDLDDITPEALAYARNRANLQEHSEDVVTLNIKLKLRVAPGCSVTEFIENLDYSVTSNTVGVVVADTEIVD